MEKTTEASSTYDHMNIQFLFYLATLKHMKANAKRFTGKRALNVLRVAQAKRQKGRVKHGVRGKPKATYLPETLDVTN